MNKIMSFTQRPPGKSQRSQIINDPFLTVLCGNTLRVLREHLLLGRHENNIIIEDLKHMHQ